MEVININISKQELDRRRERMEKLRNFEKPDRVPVMPSIDSRYYYPKIGISLKATFDDPQVLLKSRILSEKWLFENIRSDQYEINLQNYSWFQNVREASALGCEVTFVNDNQLWVKNPWVKSEGDLKRLDRVDFIHNGLHGKEIRFREKMLQLAKNYKVRLSDEGEFCPMEENMKLCADTDGPFTLAAEVRGFEQIYYDIYERPAFLKSLLEIITEKEIQWIEFARKENNDENGILWLGDDLAQNLSVELYEEFALPYEKKIREYFGGYVAFHMCGKCDHLLNHLVDELQINEFNGFGFPVDRKKVAETMGGKVVLVGNINPVNILKGTMETVIEETKSAIKLFAPYGGYIVMDGNEIPPDSPVENINAMFKAAEKYGKYCDKRGLEFWE